MSEWYSLYVDAWIFLVFVWYVCSICEICMLYLSGGHSVNNLMEPEWPLCTIFLPGKVFFQSIIHNWKKNHFLPIFPQLHDLTFFLFLFISSKHPVFCFRKCVIEILKAFAGAFAENSASSSFPRESFGGLIDATISEIKKHGCSATF